jgi:hypothetical protein
MAVHVDSDLNAPVAHLLLNVGGGNASLNQQRAERMTQVVKPEFPESGLFERGLHVTWPDVSGPIRVPASDGKAKSSATLVLPGWNARSKALSL